AFVAMGVMRSYHGKNIIALEAFREGARMEPNDAVNEFYLGYGLAKIGQNEEAKDAFKRAIEFGDKVVKKDAETAIQALNSK
ncbi:MAG: hypothetical protein JWN14_1086, partial [Chthonomonadales bacterium]|nr:hypothetical protein [Chthonomonadales bacterium]